MNTDFFVTLPSNTKVIGNITSNFKVRLPEKLKLEGQWEVAMVEIMYPHSWYNVTGHDVKKKTCHPQTSWGIHLL